MKTKVKKILSSSYCLKKSYMFIIRKKHLYINL